MIITIDHIASSLRQHGFETDRNVRQALQE